MKNALKTAMLLALVVAIALPLAAAEEQKKNEKGNKKTARQVALVAKVIKVLEGDLSEEQLAKLKEISDEYASKLAEAGKGLDRKAMNALRKKAIDEGKTNKEANAAVLASLNEEQKKAYEAHQKVNLEIRGAVAKVLTPEQQEKSKVRPPREKKKKKADAA